MSAEQTNELDARWLNELWGGSPGAAEGKLSFFGNDLPHAVDGRFVEYWPASSSGS